MLRCLVGWHDWVVTAWAPQLSKVCQDWDYYLLACRYCHKKSVQDAYDLQHKSAWKSVWSNIQHRKLEWRPFP